MKEWLKPEITESEAGMEVTSYLPAEPTARNLRTISN